MTLLKRIAQLSLLTAFLSASAFSTCVESNCTTGTQTDGSQYLLCLPEASCWNRNMVAFAHGFVDPGEPIAVPLDQLTVGGVSLPQAFNALGYGFAASSFSKNGLAIVQGITDTQDLIQNVIKPAHPDLNRVYMVGPSEGGLIATLSAEQLPSVYNAAAAACGPVGSFQAQVNYVGDFRVIFDYFFPGLIPPSPIDIPTEVITDWNSTYVPTITAALAANPSATAQLLNVMRAPSDPSTAAQTILGVLSYNIFATNDAEVTLGGQPFDNHNRLYLGSLNDFRLNLKVQRFTQDAAARAAIAAGYETSGKLKMPEVTIHTTQDPIVPYLQETLYTAKTLFAGTLLKRTNIPIVRYGHCTFTAGEVFTAFAIMVLRDTGAQIASSIETTLPERSRSEFRELAQKHGLAIR
jgi:pimeloyl-ACP methyl ester carboxylesterase